MLDYFLDRADHYDSILVIRRDISSATYQHLILLCFGHFIWVIHLACSSAFVKVISKIITLILKELSVVSQFSKCQYDILRKISEKAKFSERHFLSLKG